MKSKVGRAYARTDMTESLPPGWQVVRLGEIFDQIVDTGHSEDLPVLAVTLDRGVVRRSSLERKSEREVEKHQYLRALPGDIAYNTMRMWQGGSGLVREEGYISPAYTVCRPKQGEYPLFWAHAFKSEMMIRSFRAHSQGFAKDRYRLYFQHFSAVPTRRPPLPEQRKITVILSAMDDAVEKSAYLLSQLGSFKRAMVERLFNDLVNQPVVRMGEVLLGASYGTSNKCNSDKAGLPTLRIPNVVQGRVSTEDLKYSCLSEREVNRYRLSLGDILVVRTNGSPDYVGRTAVFDHASGVWLYASYLIRLKVNPEKVRPKFAHFALQTSKARRIIRESVRTSAGNYNLNVRDLSKVPIPLPGIEEQEDIVAALEAIEGFQQAEEQVYKELGVLRTALATALFSGQIRVIPDEAKI